MPFCQVNPDVFLHYFTNTRKGDTSDLDRTKHTVIFLPPIFCDAKTWLREQFKDPRLSDKYNLIAIDQRNMGATKSPVSPRRDSWVDAADLAIAHEILRLPPCHVFGISMNGCGAALRFAALFPNKCLSICLCGMPVQAGEDPDWVVQGYQEIIQTYCFPSDLYTLERACLENSLFAFNNQITADLLDEAIAWWQMNMPPTKRTSFLAQGLCALHRSRLSNAELRAIETPTLFLQGDKSQINPPNKAQELSDQMPNSRVFVVKGGPELMHFIPQYASVVNRVYSQFLAHSSTEPPRFPSTDTSPDLRGVCRAGLARLAVCTGDPSIAQRDPCAPFAFSCLSEKAICENNAVIAEYAKGESEAFHALNQHGQPIRKFSERHMNDWNDNRLQRQRMRDNSLIPILQTSSTYADD